MHLLHGHPLRQQEIERKINQDSFLEDDEKVNQAKLSNVLKSLSDDEIIERRPVMLEGKGAPQVASRLKRTPEALIKVLNEFYNPELEKARYFQRHLIISTYAQEIINIDLLKYIELKISNLIMYKLNVTDFHFNSQEY